MTRKEQKETRRTQIIQATLDLFVERGYYGTKTSQISRRAGISEGLLFHYFPTKEILLEELINIGLNGMRMPMQVKASDGLDFFAQFTKMLFSQVEKSPYIAKMFVFMGRVMWAEDIPDRLRKLAASVDTITFCQNWVEAGQRDGSIRIHWLTGTKKGTALRKVWETVGALDEHTAFAACDSFYTSIKGDSRVTLWKDLERTEAELLRLSPEDETEIKRFVEHVKYATGCEMPVDKPMDAMGVMDYIHMGASMADMPKVMRQYGSIDLEEMSERFKHPALRALFTDYLPKEYVASSFLVSYASVLSGNGEIPMGGSLAMANRMVKRFQELGGNLYCNAPVARILIENGKAIGIETADHKTVLADYIISSVDTMEMFAHLIGKKYIDTKWKSCYADHVKYPLFTAVQAAFVADQEAYDGRGTIFFDCPPFETGGKRVERISVKSYEYEPGFAPRGKVVLQVNVPQFDQEYYCWKGLTKEEYEEQKKEAAKAIEERLLTQFPALRGHMELLDCWTPLTYERYCNAYHGAYMSFITRKGVKAFRVKGTVKGVKNLYIASQWIMAPGGLPVAVTAGKFAVWRIVRRKKT